MNTIASLLVSACLGASPAPVSATSASAFAAAAPASASTSAFTAATAAPAKVTAGVGAFQSAPAGSAFPLRLGVTVTSVEQKPIANVPVMFTAPADGPSGWFAVGARDRRPHRVRIDTDACGVAVAPTFIADATRGGYVVTAAVAHVKAAAFALVNAGPEARP
jgi:hypothetical protein